MNEKSLESIIRQVARQFLQERDALWAAFEVKMAQMQAEHATAMLDLERRLTGGLDRIDQRLATVKDGVDGIPGERGSDGHDGRDAPLLDEIVERVLAALPAPANGIDGKDGRDGRDAPALDEIVALINIPRDGIDGKDGVDGKDGRDAPTLDEILAAIPTPQDGKDGADGKDGRDGIDGTNGRDAIDGKDGRDGEDADPVEVARIVVGLMPAPRDGRDGKDGRDAPTLAEILAAVPVPKDGKDGADGRDGVSIKGDPGDSGRDGVDGAPGQDGRDGRDVVPRGLYRAGEDYQRNDRVAHNGSEWIAKYDDPGPLPGDGWMLGAQQGKRGKPGAGIEDMAIEGYALVVAKSDGENQAVNFRPMFERFIEDQAS